MDFNPKWRNTMRKSRIVLMMASLFLTQSILAHETTSTSCNEVAKACKDAGYSSEETASKKFWDDCMKPVLMNKTVDSVTIDASTVKTCRADKIAEMKKEMEELKKVSSK
jgi:hypothetical protein